MEPAPLSDTYRRLIDNLVEARKAQGMTQTELAALGQDPAFIASFENGTHRLDVVELIAICRILKLDMPSLIRLLQSSLQA